MCESSSENEHSTHARTSTMSTYEHERSALVEVVVHAVPRGVMLYGYCASQLRMRIWRGCETKQPVRRAVTSNLTEVAHTGSPHPVQTYRLPPVTAGLTTCSVAGQTTFFCMLAFKTTFASSNIPTYECGPFTTPTPASETSHYAYLEHSAFQRCR